MTVEVLLLALACGMTLIGYMIAINAHGATRLSLSYLIATIMLAGTVWGIVQYVNIGLDARKMEELRKLELAARLAEERAQSQEEALLANKEKFNLVTKLNKYFTQGTAYASTIMNVDLQDKSVSFDELMARSLRIKKASETLKNEFDRFSGSDSMFIPSAPQIKDALQTLAEAGYFYRLYYYSENTEQEQYRERVLRKKARAAYDKLIQLSSMNSAIK